MSQLFNIVFFLLTCNVELFAAQNGNNFTAAYTGASASLIVNWINELPNYEVDFKEYKDALNKILYFFKDFRRDMDVGVVLGLRFVRVNFKHTLAYMGTKLSEADKSYIKNVIEQTDNLIQYLKIAFFDGHLKYKNIADVITATDQPWTERMMQFDMDLNKLNVERSMSLSWERYRVRINDVNRTVPTPMQSDFCLNGLAEGMPFDPAFPQECKMPSECMSMLLKGTDFGYALAHRILMLVFTNFGRNCNIIGWKEDRKMIENFCRLAKRECDYIAQHDYGIPDLLMEFTALCTTQGYTQFLKRTWFRRLLQLQTAHGCFVESFEPFTGVSRKSVRKYVRGDRNQVKNCNMHTTAVGSAALAAAIRFILETN